eukprot:766909-Hanusia_phi.AAC.2
MPAAVELQFKLDKTYDPVEALGDMKRAMEVIRATAQEEKLQKRESEEGQEQEVMVEELLDEAEEEEEKKKNLLVQFT